MKWFCQRKKGFTLIELLVVIAIIALLLSIILPSIKKAKAYARAVICKSNLRQWGYTWKIYGDDNDGKFPHWQIIGGGYHRGAWINPIRTSFVDNQKMLICPDATKIPVDYWGGVNSTYLMGQTTAAELAAGVPMKQEHCSYGMNNWCGNTGSDTDATVQNRPRENYWQRFSGAKTPSSVPVMLDAMWRGGGPGLQNVGNMAPAEPGQWISYTYEMMHFAIPRHYKGRINGHYVDLHVDDIGLKALWNQKWSKGYTTPTLADPSGARDDNNDGFPDWLDQYD